MRDPFKALYLHIPFCVKRCAYCDFATRAVKPDSKDIDKYVDRLIILLRHAAKAGLLTSLETVYIGGGTPTFIGQKRLVDLVYTLSLSADLTPEVEFTLEANPDSLTERMVYDLYALGVNRISLGIQSFDDAELALLGRIHDAAAGRRAIEMAAARMDSVSIDLMCGLPGQSMETWKRTLETACACKIDHVSVYPLTLENGTVLAKKVRRGKLPKPDDDLQADMMLCAEQMLGATGFERYEVASYARDGHRSRHNCAYWTGKPYLGLGVGAASMFSARDTRQVAEAEVIPGLEGEYVELAEDMSRIRTTLDNTGCFFEGLSAQQVAAEDAMLAMRMSEGIAPAALERFSVELPSLEAVLRECVDLGLVEHRGDGTFAPNERGWLLGNEIYERIWDLSTEGVDDADDDRA